MTTYIVSSGVTSSGVQLNSGDFEIIQSGGTAEFTVVSGGGSERVSSGGLAHDDQVLSGGVEILSQGATAYSETISAGGELKGAGTMGYAAAHGYGSGSAYDYGLVSGVQVGGTPAGLTGNLIVESGGVASSVKLVSGQLKVQAGGKANGTLVDGGAGYLLIQRGGVASNSILGGVSASEDDYGSTTSTLISSGGKQFVDSRGVATDTDILAGGAQSVEGSAISTTVLGLENVAFGGVAVGDTVLSGGGLGIGSEGVARRTRILFDGYEDVAAGGTASATILSGGDQSVWSGGAAMATVVSSGGEQVVYSGGTVSKGKVLSGGLEQLGKAAVARGVVVSSGGTLMLDGETASSGATLILGSISRTAAISGVTLESGAIRDASEVTVASGGKLLVKSGAEASDVTVASGGVLIDNGTVTVGSADLAGELAGSGALVLFGGETSLSDSGSHFIGTAMLSANTVLDLVSSGALGTGAVEFLTPTPPPPYASGDLTLEIGSAATPSNGSTFANALDDLVSARESVDIDGLTYVSGASATVNGDVLSVTDGGTMVSFRLGGTHAAQYQVVSLGSAGIGIQPIVDAQAMTEAIASFNPTAGASPLTPNHSSGGSMSALIAHSET